MWRGGVKALRWVRLDGFQITDWFPRAPGVYHTPGAESIRMVAEHFKREENGVRFYSPTWKGSMIQGGICSVRFKSLKIEDEECWLSTATSDGYSILECRSRCQIASCACMGFKLVTCSQ